MKWNYYYFDTVQSTNDTALSYPIGSVIVAQKQTAGRGRYGRTWSSDIGNLFISIVLPDFAELTPLLSFVAAVSVAYTLSNYKPRIKWPNDILINGGKVAGILLERQEDKVIMGVGINCIPVSDNINMLYSTASLQNQETKETILKRLCSNLNNCLSIFKTEGFECIRNEWLKYAIGIKQQIRVNLPNETIYGIFEELTPQGAISLKLADNTIRQITVGDIFFN